VLQLENHTPFTASMAVFPDAAGVETVYAIVKATFSIGTRGPELARQQQPLLAGDVFWGDPVASSLRAAGDFTLLKPATDVLLVGRAIAPDAETRVADVRLSVGPVSKTVRVFGDRRWEGSGSRLQPSAPLPWQRMPLRWEFAFGGLGPEGEQPRPHEPRNPVGRGLGGGDPSSLKGQLLPNLEDPAAPLQSPADRPAPACFAPLAPTWMPRRSFAGTYDEAWTAQRAPYLPLDFDARYFQLAPPGLVAPGHLQGGEAVELQGFTLGGPLRFTLPQPGVSVAFHFKGDRVPGQLQLETVLFEPDAGRFQMLWRAALPVDKHLLRLHAVELRSTQFGRDGRPPPPLARLQTLPRSYAATA
jgi:hypothetical protein